MKYVVHPELVIQSIIEEISIQFELTREAAKFHNIENQYPFLNFHEYFCLPTILTRDFEFFASMHQSDFIFFEFVDKIRLLTHLKNGRIMYKKKDRKGSVWTILIEFDKTEI